MRSKIRPAETINPSVIGEPDGSFARPPQDVVEHLGRQLAGEGVLLARVERSDQHVRADLHLRAVAEPRARSRDRVSGARDRPQDAVPREGPERHDRAELCQRFELSHQERQASIALVGRRLVPRRRAAVDGGDIGTPQREPVVTSHGCRLVREAAPMHRREQEVAAAIAGEDPSGAVTTVRRRSETDDRDGCSGIPETRDRSAPVRLVGEPRDLVTRDLLPPRDQPWARPAYDDLVGDPIERTHVAEHK